MVSKGFDLVYAYEEKKLNYLFAATAIKTFKSNAFNTIYRVRDQNTEYDDLKFGQDETDYTYHEAKEVIYNYLENSNPQTDKEWYDWQLINLYSQTQSCAEISRMTKIPERTVYNDVQGIKQKLKIVYDKIVNR
jgi:hypothetical protein